MVPTAIVPGWKSEHNQGDNFTLFFVTFLNAPPFFLSKSMFKGLDYLIISFVWNKSMPRMGKTFLEMPKSRGVLGLPSFIYYLLLPLVNNHLFLPTQTDIAL